MLKKKKKRKMLPDGDSDLNKGMSSRNSKCIRHFFSLLNFFKLTLQNKNNNIKLWSLEHR